MSGIKIFQHGVHPVIKNKDEYIKALNIIWSEKIEGWWNYKEEFLKYNVCSAQKFKEELHSIVD